MSAPPIRDIVRVARAWRARALQRGDMDVPSQLQVTVALTIAHRSGIITDWAAQLASPDYVQDHNVGGVLAHIDRRTGQLGGLFQPVPSEPRP